MMTRAVDHPSAEAIPIQSLQTGGRTLSAAIRNLRMAANAAQRQNANGKTTETPCIRTKARY
jgi:hypothetical protein